MTITHHITADQLEAMGSDARYELIQGALYEMTPSHTESSVIAMSLGIRLGTYVLDHNLGILSGESGGYLLEQDPDTVIAPDLGFIRRERLDIWPGRKGFYPAAPDLIVEVISATDEPADIRRKQELYGRVAVPMVWRIDPKRRTVAVHRPAHPVQHLSEADTLHGGDIVPGFSIQVAKLFDF